MRRLLGVVAFSTALLFATSANASSINVTTTADDNGLEPTSCSLREAVTSAQSNAAFGGCIAGVGADEVVLPGGHYKLTIPGDSDSKNVAGDIDVTGPDSLTIRPQFTDDRVTVDADRIDRAIHHLGTGALNLVNLNLENGLAFTGGGFAASAGSGNVSFSGVTISANKAFMNGGGAAFLSAGKAVTMKNSTISSNSALNNGGGVYFADNVPAAVNNVTIFANESDVDLADGGDGGGVYSTGQSGPINFSNTIVAGNRDLSEVPALKSPDCSTGPGFFPRHVISTQALGAGNCLIGFDAGTNKVVADPGLAPLEYNGGSTMTHALLPGSPAIDAGGVAAPDSCELADQRGVARPADKCDIGAFEYAVPVNPLPPEECQGIPELICHPIFPKVSGPTKEIATFDGKLLHVRLKCPARFRPTCSSKAVPVTLKGFKKVKKGKKILKVAKGKPMANTVNKKIKANKWVKITFTVKEAFRDRVLNMTRFDKKLLHTRQIIRSKKIGSRKNRKASTVFHSYKVRVQG